jgi:hypothetical protein
MSAAAAASPRHAAAIGLVVSGAAVSLLLAVLVAGVNLQRACVTQDTPYLDLCPALAPGGAAPLDALRSRIAANPGDANAYVLLALTDRSTRDQSLQAAARLTPNEPNVLLLQAAAALDREDWARAVPPLVQLVEYRDTPAAALVLARLIAHGHGDLLRAHLTPGSRWLERVLARMQQPQTPLSAALPLIAQALELGVIEPQAVRGYVHQLKTAGAWADAYSLWLALRGKAQPALHNGGFDEPFTSDGFDWEINASGAPSRAGAIAERRGGDERGSVLDVRFTGRAITVPVVRQHLFLGEGRYRLRGDYMSRQLRSEQGLAWTVRCTAGKVQAGISPPLGDTGGAWRAFAFDFAIPAGCGLVASLQLETHAPFEAALGVRGRVAFDGFSLEKLSSMTPSNLTRSGPFPIVETALRVPQEPKPLPC